MGGSNGNPPSPRKADSDGVRAVRLVAFRDAKADPSAVSRARGSHRRRGGGLASGPSTDDVGKPPRQMLSAIEILVGIADGAIHLVQQAAELGGVVGAGAHASSFAGAHGSRSSRVTTTLPHGISKATLYHWKKQYGDLQVSDAKRLKALEDENRRLKRLVADQALNLQILKDVLGKER